MAGTEQHHSTSNYHRKAEVWKSMMHGHIWSSDCETDSRADTPSSSRTWLCCHASNITKARILRLLTVSPWSDSAQPSVSGAGIQGINQTSLDQPLKIKPRSSKSQPGAYTYTSLLLATSEIAYHTITWRMVNKRSVQSIQRTIEEV